MNHPVIVASTPSFLLFIIFGTMLALCIVFVIGTFPTNATCIIPHWFGHFAFWIVFSCLFLKTARVYWIFSRNLSDLRKIGGKVKPISTQMLATILAFILICLAGYLIAWTVLDQPYAKPVLDINTVQETIYIQKCFYNKSWASALYAVELFLLAIGSLLAYKINKIKVLRSRMIAFNESPHLAVSIFCLIFVGLVIVPNVMWLSESVNTQYILNCVGIFVCVGVINIVLFGPKFMMILEGKTSDSTSVVSKNSVSS
eukprot:TRINITY_DN6435_c0_g1_i2.p1 TRINITY_DN6435_c0_g1~~TRINITY_DN6435_c0_g1_i2.p1  ORF type:complete len:257 (-),score=30.30 TRINITY_DN6435_c0_g1_i2:165-935(-)